MKEFAEIIQAIAALLWPILTFVLVWRFRAEIADLLKRLKRGKFLGQELELGDSLDKLNESALAAAAEVNALPPAEEPMTKAPENFDPTAVQENEDDEIKSVLDLAESSPKLALISLAIEIEKELREILFSQGQSGKRYTFTVPNAIRILEGREVLPPHLIMALRDFQKVRSQIIHGRGDINSNEILRAIDSGYVILSALKSIPREVNIVYHPGVEIYSDKECTQIRPDVRGVILETTNTANGKKYFRIFPTTRTHFKRGKQVAWEWSPEKSWNESWYRDPDTGEIKVAWSSALEFVGRNIDDT
ncbi:MAG: hypothetical protein ACJ74W_22450 [Pyrinomonadaceae bacterium]